MREYKIIRSELGRNISRKKEMGRLMILQYLNGHGLRTPNKWMAKTFYNREDAAGALVVCKRKDEKKPD